MKKCKHKFKSRYNEVFTTPIEVSYSTGMAYSSSPPWAFKPQIKSRTYIHDVCVKCGQIAKEGGE